MKPERQWTREERGRPVSRARAGVSTSLLAAGAASIFLLAAGAAQAADDRFDRTRYDGMGGFQPVANETYRKECGACHFAYLPGMLPARSWNRVMEKLGDHFGENVQLGDDLSARLRDYLTANAADKVPERGPALMLERLDPGRTPERITQIPLMIRMHTVIREVFKVNGAVRARNITNCDSCHQKAAEGSFALRDMVVPGLTKVVRPGGAF
jgi:mono/diheme cytochrome c family protein